MYASYLGGRWCSSNCGGGILGDGDALSAVALDASGYAYVGGCSKVTQDVPPFVMADGVPATARAVNVIGMRRGGVNAEGRRGVRAAFRILYRSGLAPGAATAQLKAELGGHPLVARLIEFIEGSRRGIVRGLWPGLGEPEGAGEDAESEERVW